VNVPSAPRFPRLPKPIRERFGPIRADLKAKANRTDQVKVINCDCEEEGKMAWDKWRVSKVKDSDPEEFMLTFLDTALEHAKPFMRTSDPMSESELREELGNEGISRADIDAAIQAARAEPAEAA
jgi:hypothetical protein